MYVKVERVGQVYEAFSNDYPHVFARWRPGERTVNWHSDVAEDHPALTGELGETGQVVSLDEFRRYVRRKRVWDGVYPQIEGRGRGGRAVGRAPVAEPPALGA